jgi:hypothetical protein
MKFNWGHGIFIFLTIFLLSMAFVVYKGFQEKNALVEEEYYPKGLAFQQQIDRRTNADAMSEKIKLEEMDGNVVVTYPALFAGKKLDGTLYFYRPSDDAGDFKESMISDSLLQQKIPLKKLMQGKYIVKLSWKMDGKEYYHEEALLINR